MPVDRWLDKVPHAASGQNQAAFGLSTLHWRHHFGVACAIRYGAQCAIGTHRHMATIKGFEEAISSIAMQSERPSEPMATSRE